MLFSNNSRNLKLIAKNRCAASTRVKTKLILLEAMYGKNVAWVSDVMYKFYRITATVL